MQSGSVLVFLGARENEHSDNVLSLPVVQSTVSSNASGPVPYMLPWDVPVAKPSCLQAAAATRSLAFVRVHTVSAGVTVPHLDEVPVAVAIFTSRRPSLPVIPPTRRTALTEGSPANAPKRAKAGWGGCQ